MFTVNIAFTQDRGSLYLGLYSGGTIEQFSRRVTAPYFTDLNYYTITLYPKLGYSYKNITIGALCSYTFHKNTFESLEPTWGYGYFIKYKYLKKNRTSDKKISLQFFGEWQHYVDGGYYVPLPPDYWHRTKIYSQVTTFSLQGGFDILFPKSFSIGLGMGVGAFNTLKEPFNPESGRPFRVRPFGTVTFQYNLKL